MQEGVVVEVEELEEGPLEEGLLEEGPLEEAVEEVLEEAVVEAMFLLFLFNGELFQMHQSYQETLAPTDNL